MSNEDNLVPQTRNSKGVTTDNEVPNRNMKQSEL
jgi:hypothetical protein